MKIVSLIPVQPEQSKILLLKNSEDMAGHLDGLLLKTALIWAVLVPSC